VVKGAARFGLAVEVPKSIHLLDGCQGAGREGVPDEHLLGIATLARQEGVVLDPVYTGKAFLGLVDALRRDPKAFGQRICFIHTGGIFSLFPFRGPLSRLLDARDGLAG
jgi:1-aminocyclopropane-1-carboxylate deaminase/D-cysteine desulfhydrase-like pyridoxal-dependent ACC family enzyme